VVFGPQTKFCIVLHIGCLPCSLSYVLLATLSSCTKVIKIQMIQPQNELNEGVTLFNKVRSSEVRKSLLLLFQIERSLLWWFAIFPQCLDGLLYSSIFNFSCLAVVRQLLLCLIVILQDCNSITVVKRAKKSNLQIHAYAY